ncbi:MAG: two-component sensor histidine kinase [Deltaproteobacteria bacterium]|nr:MAG: two-component sensor histidine kinase [Deltaproteobacteria bacterium]
MKELRSKILLFTVTATLFLVIQLIGYVYNINFFKEQLAMLEWTHDFMEDVLELRRYEKNFVYFIDKKDLNEMLLYLKKIKSEINNIKDQEAFKDIFEELSSDFKRFENDLIIYENLILIAKKKNKVDLRQIRKYGKNMLTFAEKLLNLNKKHIEKTLNKILYIPSNLMVLFCSALIILLIILTRPILKQISFIQQTTERISKGDFSYIPQDSQQSSSFSLIIGAFNRMIRELDERQNALIQAKKLSAVGTLVSGIAHELNNPLNNISLTAEAILEDFSDLSKEEIEEMLQEILEEARRASSVVKNLLDFSRRRKTDITELIDIKKLIDSTIKIVKNQLMLSDIQLIRNIPSDLPKIKGNEDNLKQVFINLFLNAIQAMPNGGYLKITAREKEGFIEIAVEDRGVGMPPEVMERIFDPFFSTKPVGKGTGLGLSIVYGIVKKHGGHIEVKSRQGQGTTFFVYLPVQSQNAHN